MKNLARRLINGLIPRPAVEVTPISLAADFVFAEAIPGDYLEFGVFKGASFIEAVNKLEASQKNMG